LRLDSKEEAAELQQEFKRLEGTLAKGVDSVWTEREQDWKDEAKEDESRREAGLPVEKPPEEEELRRVERPKLAAKRWKIPLLDVL
jgi:hypothetical protein